MRRHVRRVRPEHRSDVVRMNTIRIPTYLVMGEEKKNKNETIRSDVFRRGIFIWKRHEVGRRATALPHRASRPSVDGITVRPSRNHTYPGPY